METATIEGDLGFTEPTRLQKISDGVRRIIHKFMRSYMPQEMEVPDVLPLPVADAAHTQILERSAINTVLQV